MRKVRVFFTFEVVLHKPSWRGDDKLEPTHNPDTLRAAQTPVPRASKALTLASSSTETGLPTPALSRRCGSIRAAPEGSRGEERRSISGTMKLQNKGSYVYRRQWTRSRRDEDREQGSNEENYRTFKEEKGKLKKLIQEAKRTKWKDLINELEEDIWGEAYTIVVKKLKRVRPETLKEEEENRVIEALFPQQERTEWGEYTGEGFNVITLEEIKEAMGKMKKGKAPGMDGLTAEIWQAVAEKYPQLLQNTFNKLLEEVRGKRQWRGGGINIGGIMLPIKNEAKYLGNLTQFRGPSNKKEKDYKYYGAEIWAPAMDVQKYRKQLETVHRRLLIRVVAAYRTVSLEALQVISGIPPIDLLARERRDKYVYGETKQQIRARTMRIWEERWSRGIKGAWTRELISNVGRWVDRKHGEVGYHFTQWLTGHGSFGRYRRKINKTITAECYHCEQDVEDNPEHTFFRCPRWVDVREGLEREVGNTLRPGVRFSSSYEFYSNANMFAQQNTHTFKNVYS
ncbi:hypothetical protein NQ315_003295 [Exocentrus adspersus]|uniref:Reverse transcriptase n=1 Tax=Exocentrus adspersus TaxID=1586481 RepID=A0AAV8VAQ7_9CUCU|nr:hypothetical protein NQ315_003295 [Exocentrus adspersus]